MIFVTGPLFAGKRNFIKNRLGMTDEEFENSSVWDVQEQARGMDTNELEILAGRLAQKTIVIETETGGGVIPMDEKERKDREAAGRLSIMLAERADTVVRVVCGIGTVIKGEL